MVGYSQQELEECRPLAMKVADFCAKRWNMEYEEVIGSTTLLEQLIRMPARIDGDNSEFVVLPPGGQIEVEMFLREGEAAPQVIGRGE